MSTFITRLRERPEHHRKAVAFGVSGGVTLLLFLGWAITLPAQFGSVKFATPAVDQGQQALSQNDQSAAIAGVGAAVPETPSASISSVFDQGIQAFKDIGASFGTYFSHPSNTTGPALQVVPNTSQSNSGMNSQTGPKSVSYSSSFDDSSGGSVDSDGVVITDPQSNQPNK